MSQSCTARLTLLGCLLVCTPQLHAQHVIQPGVPVDPPSSTWRTLYLPILETDPSGLRRRQAALLIGQYGDGQAIPPLAKAAAFDTDREVRIAAGDAIALIRQRTHDHWINRPPLPLPGNAEQLVHDWYQLYLHRAPDPGGLAQWVGELNRGTPPELVQATLLASDEYYRRHGGTPHLWIANIFKELLGRTPSRDELRLWLGELARIGAREAVALEILRAGRAELVERRRPIP